MILKFVKVDKGELTVGRQKKHIFKEWIVWKIRLKGCF
jgi:hypothetical protein